jgi:hypothetical protein
MPALADPGPLVTRVRNRTVAKVDSIGSWFSGEPNALQKLEEREELVAVTNNFCGCFGPFDTELDIETFDCGVRISECCGVANVGEHTFADGCCVLGNAARTFPALWNQHR